MNPKPHDPAAFADGERSPADLVDHTLNKPLADQLDAKPEEPARSGVSDYARGTAEHDDDPEG